VPEPSFINVSKNDDSSCFLEDPTSNRFATDCVIEVDWGLLDENINHNKLFSMSSFTLTTNVTRLLKMFQMTNCMSSGMAIRT